MVCIGGSSVKKPLFIYVTGCDGTGKSTQSRALLALLAQNGYPARLLWQRFPFFFSIPLLVYARLRRFSWYETSAGYRQGYWDFSRSWLLRVFFPWAYLLDAWLASIFFVAIPMKMGVSLVCERYTLDMAVDLAVALRQERFLAGLPARWLMALLPKNASVFLLDLDVETLLVRRPELVQDRNLEMKLRLYRWLAELKGFPLLAGREFAEMLTHYIWQRVGIQ